MTGGSRLVTGRAYPDEGTRYRSPPSQRHQVQHMARFSELVRPIVRLGHGGMAALQKFKKGGRPDALLRAEGGDLFGKPLLFGNLFGF